MTAETARIIGMAKVVWISGPVHFEVWKDVPLVNRKECLHGGPDIGGPFTVDRGVLFPLKARQTYHGPFLPFPPPLIISLDQFPAPLLNKRHTGWNLARGAWS